MFEELLNGVRNAISHSHRSGAIQLIEVLPYIEDNKERTQAIKNCFSNEINEKASLINIHCQRCFHKIFFHVPFVKILKTKRKNKGVYICEPNLMDYYIGCEGKVNNHIIDNKKIRLWFDNYLIKYKDFDKTEDVDAVKTAPQPRWSDDNIVKIGFADLYQFYIEILDLIPEFYPW